MAGFLSNLKRSFNILSKSAISESFITNFEYNSRRKQLQNLVNQTQKYKMKDVPYKFCQSTNMIYFTGYPKSNSYLIMLQDKNYFDTFLFVEKLNYDHIIWDGPNLNDDKIRDITGINKIMNLNDISSQLNSLISSKKVNLWMDDFTFSLKNIQRNLIDIFKEANSTTENNIENLIQTLRITKSKQEQQIMAKCCDIGCQALKETMKYSFTQEVPEAILESKFELESKLLGSNGLAYIPVIAGGNRACTIHYIDNNNIIDSEDGYILMDAGCQYQNYCSDITRTWPILNNNNFNSFQRELYDALLDVQLQCILACTQPNTISLDQLLMFMYHQMIKNFEEIHLLPSSLSYFDKLKAVQKLCPHHVGHHLGLDVHDCNLVSRDESLKPGMVITIEPGVYVRNEFTEFPKELRGTGIRIEDDILITDSTPLNMTSSCPKELDALSQFSKINE